MTFSNIKNVIRIRQIKLFFTIGFIVPITISFASNWFQDYIVNLSPFIFAGIFFIIYLFIILYFELLKHYYIQFSDESDKIIIRYYPLRIFGRNYKAIEINKNLFEKFESRISFFGKVEEIILFQNTKKGIINYPPISLSALSENDKVRLKKALLSCSKQN